MAPIRRNNQVKKLKRTTSCPTFLNNIDDSYEESRRQDLAEHLQPAESMTDAEKKSKFDDFQLTDKVICRFCSYTGSRKGFKPHIGGGEIIFILILR